MRIIDLSVALKAGIASDPPSMLPKIEYMDHKQGAQDFAMMFPGLKPEQLPNGEGAAMERITFTTHNGTHLDAPWHFASTMDGGKPAMKIRRDPAGMVLLLGREARLPRQARRLCVQGGRCRTRTRPHRLYAQTARHRAGEHCGRHRLRPAEFSRQRLRHGPGGHAFSAQARRARHRHRRLELGRAVFIHRQALPRNRRSEPDLGRPQSRPRHRLLPHGKADQSRGAAAVRLQGRAASR